MDLAEYLGILEGIRAEFQPSKQDKCCLAVCRRFYQSFVDHVSKKKIPTEAALTALASTLSLFSKMRSKVPADLNWDQLGHVIFVEAARVVLGLDFQRLDDTDPASPKSVFKSTLSQAYLDLQSLPCGEFYLVLQWLVVNGWTHPILQDMMKGSDIEEDKVQTYLSSGEYPEIFRLRVDMLMENGCDDFALNLATWCTKSPVFQSDPYIRSAQLLLLIKMNRQEEFHNACWQIWQFQCCLSLRILKVILSKGHEEDKRPLLTLTQTFLVHDWMKPDKYCCTEPLLKFWLSLEREQEPNADIFIQSLSKMEQLASNARQLQILIKALSIQFPGEFLQFNLECMLSAIRMDRNKLDTARIYVKDDKEADQAADSLARSCLVIALMFKDDVRIQLAANMTAFYLDPTEEMYHKIKKAVLANQSKANNTKQDGSVVTSDEEELVPQDPIVPPSDVDGHTFYELMHAVDTLRPNTFSIYSSWSSLQKHLRASLEEAGYVYNHRKDTFITFEERMLRKRKAMEKAQRKKSRDDVPKRETRIDLQEKTESNDRSESGEQPAQMNNLGLNDNYQKGSESEMSRDTDPTPQMAYSQSVSADSCAQVINATKQPVSMPLLDITLDELQQVLDSSNHSKVMSNKDMNNSGEDGSLMSEDNVQQKESSEDIMLNSIKEFLKGGDVEMQGLMSSEPDPNMTTVCNNPAGAQSTELVQQQPVLQQPGQTQLINQQSSVQYAGQQPTATAVTQAAIHPSKVNQTSSAERTVDTLVKADSDEPIVFKCKYCGKAYSSIRQRRRHQEWLCKSKVNAAAGEKDLVDLVKEMCRAKSTFDDSSYLRDDYGNYLCEICRRPCGTVNALKLHQRRAHSSCKAPKANLPSGISIKECSVKLDRLEDAPIPKLFRKYDQPSDKGKDKDGINKLLSKKYSTGFFLASLKNKGKNYTEKNENRNDKMWVESSKENSKKTRECTESSTDDLESDVNSTEVDLNAGDAQVELCAPSDDSQPVLCDLCGAVCPSYQAMKQHQASCVLAVKAAASPTNKNSTPASVQEVLNSLSSPSSSSLSSQSTTMNDVTVLPSLTSPVSSIQTLIPFNNSSSISSQSSHSKGALVVESVSSSPTQDVTTKPNSIASSKDKNKQNSSKNRPKNSASPAPKTGKKLVTLSYRTCLTCNMEFSTASTCFQHQSDMSHFQGGIALVTKYKCVECGQIFGTSLEGEAHITTHEHGSTKKKPNKSPSIKKPPKNKTKATGGEIFRSLLVYCQYCKKGFLSQTSLDTHLLQGCEAKPAVNSMMIVQPTLTEGFDVSMQSVANLMQYNTPQLIQAVDGFNLGTAAQLTSPVVTNEIVVMAEQMAPEVVLDQLSSSYITAIPDTNSGITELTGQMDTLANSNLGVSRQETATQVDIDNVPLAELEKDMKELAPDLMCNDDPMVDVMIDSEQQKYPCPDGNVQVETITYKNVSMLQHKMSLCSVCGMEFALKKDVCLHWEQTSCKDQNAEIVDANNFQCVYCGEMFSEPGDCRDHQLASCLKMAGMKVQLLKNRHFHCRMCKSRYYERADVEKHLFVYHKLSKDEVEARINEWFPDSYVRGIEEMLRSKKSGKHRSASHADSQEANKNTGSVMQNDGNSSSVSAVEKNSSTQIQNSTANNSIILQDSFDVETPASCQPQVVSKSAVNKTSQPVVIATTDISQSGVVMSSQVMTSATALTSACVPTTVQSSQSNTSLLLPGNMPADSSKEPVSLTSVQCSDSAPVDSRILSPQALSNLANSIHSSPLTDAQNIEVNSCSSPVPTCNISWSLSPGSVACTQNADHLLLPAPSVPGKTNKKSKKSRRSSSTDSQLSVKEKKSRGRSPVAPPEYHPCPKCGKVIEDRIALQIHMDFICGKSPTQINAGPRTAPKSTKKRRRQNSQGSAHSAGHDTSDSRSMLSDDGSISSVSRANTPSHAGPEVEQARGHVEGPRWKCSLCPENFIQPSELEKHVLAVHTQILNFATCPRCGQLYDGSSALGCDSCVKKQVAGSSTLTPTQTVGLASCPLQQAAPGHTQAPLQTQAQAPLETQAQTQIQAQAPPHTQADTQAQTQVLVTSSVAPFQNNLQVMTVSTQSDLSKQTLEVLVNSKDSSLEPKDIPQKTVMAALNSEQPVIQNIISNDFMLEKLEKQREMIERNVRSTSHQTELDTKPEPAPEAVQIMSPGHKDSDTDSGCDEGPELDKALQDEADNLILPLMLPANCNSIMYAGSTSTAGYSVAGDVLVSCEQTEGILRTSSTNSQCNGELAAQNQHNLYVHCSQPARCEAVPTAVITTLGTTEHQDGNNAESVQVSSPANVQVSEDVNISLETPASKNSPSECKQSKAVTNYSNTHKEELKLVNCSSGEEALKTDGSCVSHSCASDTIVTTSANMEKSSPATDAHQAEILADEDVNSDTERTTENKKAEEKKPLIVSDDKELSGIHGQNVLKSDSAGTEAQLPDPNNQDLLASHADVKEKEATVNQSSAVMIDAIITQISDGRQTDLVKMPGSKDCCSDVKVTQQNRGATAKNVFQQTSSVNSEATKPLRITRSMRQRMENQAWVKARMISADDVSKVEMDKTETETKRECLQVDSQQEQDKAHGESDASNLSKVGRETMDDMNKCSTEKNSGEYGAKLGSRKDNLQKSGTEAEGDSSLQKDSSDMCKEQDTAMYSAQSKNNRPLAKKVQPTQASKRTTRLSYSCPSKPDNGMSSAEADMADWESGCSTGEHKVEDSKTAAVHDEKNVDCKGKTINNGTNSETVSSMLAVKETDLRLGSVCTVDDNMAENKSDANSMDEKCPEDKDLNRESDIARLNKALKPKTIEEPGFDFQSVVAKAVKAWSKPSTENKKNKSEKLKSLDVLLSRKRVPQICVPRTVPRTKSELDSGVKTEVQSSDMKDTLQNASSKNEVMKGAANVSLKQNNKNQNSFMFKWKSFGKQPQEVSINLPLVEKVQNSSVTTGKETDCGQQGKVSSSCDGTLRTAVSASNSDDSCQSVSSEGLKSSSSEPGCDSSVQVAPPESPGCVDFMEYHKELHKIVKVEGVEVSLNDEADLLIPESEDRSVIDLDMNVSKALDTDNFDVVDECGFLQDGHYICPFCDVEKSFRLEYNLTSHLKCVHGVTKDEPVQEQSDWLCPICKDLPAFDELLMLLYHMRAVHGIANFDVGNTSTRFPRTPEKVNTNMQTHAKLSSPKESKLAGSRNDADSDLESTCSDVSNITGITSIESGISLQEDFISKHPELAAKVVSAPRVCSTCNKAFLKMEHYQNHMVRHHSSEQKALQWRCGLCSKLFLRHDDWRRHLHEHFPSRKGTRQKESLLTASEKQVLREATQKTDVSGSQDKTTGPTQTAADNQSVDGQKSGFSRWDELFGVDAGADKTDKITRTYSRSSSNTSRRSVRMLRHPAHYSGTEEALEQSNELEKPNTTTGSSDSELMEPLSVSIPSDVDDRFRDDSHDSQSDSQSYQYDSQSSNMSRSSASVCSLLSKSERMSPASIASNPEFSSHSQCPVGKRRHSSDGHDTRTLETRSNTVRPKLARTREWDKQGLSLRRQLRSKDKENSTRQKANKNVSAQRTSSRVKSDPRRLGSRLRPTPRSVRHAVDTKSSLQSVPKSPDVCWKLPWEHYLRNTLRKQVSATRKTNHSSSEDSTITKSVALCSRRKLTTGKSLAPKGEPVRGTRMLSRRGSSDSLGRRRCSLSDSVSGYKRLKADCTSIDTTDRQQADNCASSRRLVTRLSQSSEVKGMALHTRRAEQSAGMKTARRSPVKNK